MILKLEFDGEIKELKIIFGDNNTKNITGIGIDNSNIEFGNDGTIISKSTSVASSQVVTEKFSLEEEEERIPVVDQGFADQQF